MHTSSITDHRDGVLELDLVGMFLVMEKWRCAAATACSTTTSLTDRGRSRLAPIHRSGPVLLLACRVRTIRSAIVWGTRRGVSGRYHRESAFKRIRPGDSSDCRFHT